MKRFQTTVLVALAAAAVAAPAAAPVLTLSRVISVTAAGQTTERLETAQGTRPGDLLQVAGTVTLTGGEKGARFTVPVPANTTFVPGSARAAAGVRVTYALNKGGTFSAQPMKTVTVQEGGRALTKQVPAPQNEYRAVRYDLTGLKGSVTVSHRIRVN